MARIAEHITYRATLRMPAAQTHPENTGRRMRAEIDRLRRDQRQARAAQSQSDTEGGISNAAFRRFGGSDCPVYELRVSGLCPDAVLAELARLTLALVTTYPISHIGWLRDEALLDRGAFLTALAPPPSRPTRPARPDKIRTPRPPRRKARLNPDEAQWLQENVIRMDLCHPVNAAERADMRRELGLPGPERRVASAALATAALGIAMNASGAMASVLSATGLG